MPWRTTTLFDARTCADATFPRFGLVRSNPFARAIFRPLRNKPRHYCPAASAFRRRRGSAASKDREHRHPAEL
jgi:hypothetical protein